MHENWIHEESNHGLGRFGSFFSASFSDAQELVPATMHHRAELPIAGKERGLDISGHLGAGCLTGEAVEFAYINGMTAMDDRRYVYGGRRLDCRTMYMAIH